MNGLSLDTLYKSFGKTIALAGVTFDVARGEIIAVLGPSGCGKSTLLSIIAGLESPDSGTIRWEGKDLAGVPTHRRGFGLMFQDFALFPHMNVTENVAFGLRNTPLNPPIETPDGGKRARWLIQKSDGRRKEGEKVTEMLKLVGLPGFEHRDVNTLSGGEQQRVALARALAPQPRLLMLDEPLGSLDRDLRERLIGDLRLILHRMHQTAVYVTHDQAEAFAIADRLVVMKAGCVEQVGTPQEIYNHPASPFVAGFIGLTNLIDGTATTEGIVTPIGRFPNPSRRTGPVTVLIRPEKAQLSGEASCALEGIVSERSFRGQAYHLVLDVGTVRMAFDLTSSEPVPTEGERVKICLDKDSAVQAFARGDFPDLPAS